MPFEVCDSPRSLAGKVALVSGSSAGIGKAVVQKLSQRGASVVINYPYPREEPRARSVLESLGPHASAIIVEANLSTTDGPRILAETTANTFGKIDILVNNAGIMIPTYTDEPDDAKVEQAFEKVVNLNGRGTFLLTRAVLKYLTKGNSRIVNIASCVSRNPGADSSVYAGSKGMVEAFTRTWTRELSSKYGCTVNAIAPGPVSTETFCAAPASVQEQLRPMIEQTPSAPRAATPQEVAWTVAMLCEEEANWINGVYIPVAGGSTLL
ncbi:hypothetical protein AJ79_10195 [Helicocarpus griseus UAMH5409]|uniref:3-oxoacyl-[acyl-carrier-protein] reductase n=1 Tax=Helicocarpus griseus UAMH5409 TaxID=1447875 RepID=A0A2B7W6R4_9EURO|nr:hypothetical protein AJ79_10195 [Helicocarpus griseus UAMH5409]